MKTKVKKHKRGVGKKRIFVRIEKAEFGKGYDVTVQTEGYPKTSGYVEGLGDTVGLAAVQVKAIAKDVAKEVQRANPDAVVILK